MGKEYDTRPVQIKSRQDMELRAAGEASHRFRAHHLPRSTSEPR